MITKKTTYYMAIVLLVGLLFVVLGNALLRPTQSQIDITGTIQSLEDIFKGDEYEQTKEDAAIQEAFQSQTSAFEKNSHRSVAKLLQTMGQLTEYYDIQIMINKVVWGLVEEVL